MGWLPWGTTPLTENSTLRDGLMMFDPSVRRLKSPVADLLSVREAAERGDFADGPVSMRQEIFGFGEAQAA